MWHSRFLGTILAVLAFPGFMGSQTVLAAYPDSPEFSMSQPQGTRGLEGSFQLAVMGSSTAPLDMPPEKSPAKVQPEKPAVKKPIAVIRDSTVPPEKSAAKVQPEKPAVEQPVAAQKEEPKKVFKPKKASKPKKKKVKKANVKKAPVKKPVEEEGFLTKTFKQLIGSGDAKKEAASESQLQKTAGKVPEKEKEEEGFLTKTLKSLVGGGEKKEKTAKKNPLNPINVAPTGSATKKEGKEQPKTAKSETKKTLKDSFERLIGVGAVKDKGDTKSAKTDKSAEATKSAKKKESGGLLDGILGGSGKKKDSSATKQAKVKDKVKKTSAPAKPRKLAAKKFTADDEEGEGQSGSNYGGAKKGKNLLKESFKTLVADDKKKEEEE